MLQWLLVHAWDVSAEILSGSVLLLIGSLFAWTTRRRRLAAEAAKRDHAVLCVIADLVQIQVEEALWRDWMTSTGRVAPLDQGVVMEQRGAYRQRRREGANRLRMILENDRRRGPRDTQRIPGPQDVFAKTDPFLIDEVPHP